MRVKGGFVTRRRHKRLLKRSSGYMLRKGNCFKLADRAVQKAGQYAYKHRKMKKRDYRTLWIARVNAAARLAGLSYSKLMFGLKRASITMNRKMLAELAISDPAGFRSVAEKAKAALAV